MPSSNPKDYSLQRETEIVDVSDPAAVKVRCRKKNGQWTQFSLSWADETYPNRDLKRLSVDTRGMLKPAWDSNPNKGFGQLYVTKALAAANSLPDDKYPSELPARVVYYPVELGVRSLVLTCLNPNGHECTVDLATELNADLSLGFRIQDGTISVGLSEAAIVGDLQASTPANATQLAQTSGPGQPPSNGRDGVELARLALEYCSTVPDTQLRAMLVPLLRALAGRSDAVF